jgi:hypothetical protein
MQNAERFKETDQSIDIISPISAKLMKLNYMGLPKVFRPPCMTPGARAFNDEMM